LSLPTLGAGVLGITILPFTVVTQLLVLLPTHALDRLFMRTTWAFAGVTDISNAKTRRDAKIDFVTRDTLFRFRLPGHRSFEKAINI
jgi:hypothetical protein